MSWGSFHVDNLTEISDQGRKQSEAEEFDVFMREHGPKISAAAKLGDTFCRVDRKWVSDNIRQRLTTLGIKSYNSSYHTYLSWGNDFARFRSWPSDFKTSQQRPDQSKWFY